MSNVSEKSDLDKIRPSCIFSIIIVIYTVYLLGYISFMTRYLVHLIKEFNFVSIVPDKDKAIIIALFTIFVIMTSCTRHLESVILNRSKIDL